MRNRLHDEWIVFLLAVQFLTRLPVPRDIGWSETRMQATPRWYPAVGAVVGLLVAAVYVGSVAVFPVWIAALLSTAAGILVTGAFHEDGLADACDGLGGAVSRERSLEIMRDSRLGTYGAVGLGLVLAIKIGAIAAIPMDVVPYLLIAGHAVSRASSVVVIATAEYVRDHGTGKPIARGTGGLSLALASAAIAAGPLFWLAPTSAIIGLAGAALGHVAMRRVFERRLGGYTGDCLGAVQQISEIGFYLGVLAAI